MRPGWAGFQPSSCCVCALDVGLSSWENKPRKLSADSASSGVTLIAGTSR